MITFILMIFCWLEAMFTDRLRRKSTSKKYVHIKAWYMILGTEISSYEEFHCKTTQISEENELYQAKWKQSRQLSLCNNAWLQFHSGNNVWQSKLEAISDSSTFCISVMTVKTLHHKWWILLKYVKP